MQNSLYSLSLNSRIVRFRSSFATAPCLPLVGGYDGQNIFVEFDENNNLLARHTHNPLTLDDILSTNYTGHAVNAQIAQYAGNFYYLKDHLGSIMDITDSSGTVIQKYDYKSFGRILAIKSGNGDDIASNPVVRNAFTYTGREWESEVDLFYYRARWYSPTTGRFLQSDPDPGKLTDPTSTINKFIYARNAPSIFKDATGKDWLGDLLVGIVGFVAGFFLGPVIAASMLAGVTTGAAFYVTSAIAGALVGGIAGGFANVLSHNGSFEKGFGIGALGGFLGGLAGAAYFGSDMEWRIAQSKYAKGDGLYADTSTWDVVKELFSPEPVKASPYCIGGMGAEYLYCVNIRGPGVPSFEYFPGGINDGGIFLHWDPTYGI